METIKELVVDEIKAIDEDMCEYEPGSEQYNSAVTRMDKLMSRLVDMEKVTTENKKLELENKKLDYDAKKFSIEDKKIEVDSKRTMNEYIIAQAQIDDERNDRLVKNVLSGLGIALPLLVTIWGTCKSIQFEKDGTFTTIMGRGFVQKLLPKK